MWRKNENDEHTPTALSVFKELTSLLEEALSVEQNLSGRLIRYAQHRTSCDWMQEGGDCTCGLQKLRDDYRSVHPDG